MEMERPARLYTGLAEWLPRGIPKRFILGSLFAGKHLGVTARRPPSTALAHVGSVRQTGHTARVHPESPYLQPNLTGSIIRTS